MHECIFFSWLSMFVCFPCSVWCLVALAISLSSCFQINLCVSNCLLVVLQYQKICLNTHFLLAICIRNWCQKAQKVKPLLCNFCASCCDSFFVNTDSVALLDILVKFLFYVFIGHVFWNRHYPFTLNLSINHFLPLSTGENGGADTENKYVQYPDNLNIKGRTIIVFVIWFW